MPVVNSLIICRAHEYVVQYQLITIQYEFFLIN